MLEVFLVFLRQAAPRGAKRGGAPQTALSLAAASRGWLLFSWEQQKTCRKVDQFSAMTFFFEISRELEVKQTRPIWRDNLFFWKSTENLKLCRAWSFIFVLAIEDQHQLARFCGPICKKICPPLRTTL